jgi:hypothetical protein
MEETERAAERIRTSTSWRLRPPTLPLVYGGRTFKRCRREDSNLHYMASQTTDSAVGLRRHRSRSRERSGSGGRSRTDVTRRMRPGRELALSPQNVREGAGTCTQLSARAAALQATSVVFTVNASVGVIDGTRTRFAVVHIHVPRLLRPRSQSALKESHLHHPVIGQALCC